MPAAIAPPAARSVPARSSQTRTVGGHAVPRSYLRQYNHELSGRRQYARATGNLTPMECPHWVGSRPCAIVCTENLNPDVVVMKSAKDRV